MVELEIVQSFGEELKKNLQCPICLSLSLLKNPTLLSVIQFLFLVHISGCQSTQPNIVITIGNGVGWGDIGANNAFNTHTPVIDMLANAGVNYLDFHIGGNTAGPSMAALLTGRHGQRNGVRKDFSPFSIGGLPQSENTIGDYLKGIGYTTGYIGVWDLGHQPPYLPLSRGFDFFYGTPFDPVHGCVHLNNMYIPSNVNLNMKCSPDKIGVPVMEGGNILEQPLNMQNISIIPILYAKAKKFINNASNEKKPFLLIISPTQINLPIFDSDAKYPKKEELLSQLDNAVAMTQELLETYNLTRNTISMFTSKTGPIDANCAFSGDVGPYRGLWQRFANSLSAPTMGTNWEGATKVPLVISWPEGISTSYRNIELKSAVDLVPTLAEITGFKLPYDRTFDGKSMTKDWNNNGVQDPVSRILYFLEPDTDEVFAFRKDDLKIYFRTTGAKKCNCSYDPSKEQNTHHPYPLVFDLSHDQSELNNITYDGFRAAFRAAFLEWKKKGDELFSQDPGLKSTADYSESKSAAPCCNSRCECHSSALISDLVLLMFGETHLNHNYSVIVAEPDLHFSTLPQMYGLVFLCLGMSVFLIYLVYKFYTFYMNLHYGYQPILNETEIEELSYRVFVE